MFDDPIVAETRRLREEVAARFDFDLDAICRALQEEQRKSGRPLVKRGPTRAGGGPFISPAVEPSATPEPENNP